LFAAVLLLSNPATAQMTRGAISGTVRDQTAAAIPGVTVTATNSDTGATRSAVSDAIGFYRLPALEPGTYTVRAELSGFTSFSTRSRQRRYRSQDRPQGRSRGESTVLPGQQHPNRLAHRRHRHRAQSLSFRSADRNVNNLIATPERQPVSGGALRPTASVRATTTQSTVRQQRHLRHHRDPQVVPIAEFRSDQRLQRGLRPTQVRHHQVGFNVPRRSVDY
jgi:hypothetical protein